MNKPTLVLISGAPGTGKTFLARRLAEALPVVILEKDAIKETLFDTVGEGDREWSRKLGGATFALLRMLVQSHLKAGQSVVAEAAFWHEHEVPWLDRMKEKYDFDTLETALPRRPQNSNPEVYPTGRLGRQTQRTPIGNESGRPGARDT